MITKETIEGRKTELVAQLQKALQQKEQAQRMLDSSTWQAQALAGAIQDCDFWLAKFEPEDAIDASNIAVLDGSGRTLEDVLAPASDQPGAAD